MLSVQGETPAAMVDMEATMEITCTEGNAVAMVSVFEQHLSKNTATKYMSVSYTHLTLPTILRV